MEPAGIEPVPPPCLGHHERLLLRTVVLPSQSRTAASFDPHGAQPVGGRDSDLGPDGGDVDRAGLMAIGSDLGVVEEKVLAEALGPLYLQHGRDKEAIAGDTASCGGHIVRLLRGHSPPGTRGFSDVARPARDTCTAPGNKVGWPCSLEHSGSGLHRGARGFARWLLQNQLPSQSAGSSRNTDFRYSGPAGAGSSLRRALRWLPFS